MYSCGAGGAVPVADEGISIAGEAVPVDGGAVLVDDELFLKPCEASLILQMGEVFLETIEVMLYSTWCLS